ncbi:MAG TPA: hypothetical protein VJ596_02930 [Gemmatimonadaceae bacterium]|nr:hypothetical protein [Gemmatimonadaceae bacterium]
MTETRERIETSGQPPTHAATAVDTIEHEQLADARVRELLRGYVALSGAQLRELGPHRFELTVPLPERSAFGGRERVHVAFSVEAMQEDAEAEMAVVGSAFVDQLIAAVRARGVRQFMGLVPPNADPDAETVRLQASVVNGSAGDPVTDLSRHTVGRLTAKVTLRAGASVEEFLVDSGFFDLVTGQGLGTTDWGLGRGNSGASTSPNPQSPVPDPERSAPARVLPLMLTDLEERLAAEIERLGAGAERALAHEVARIDRYYAALLADSAVARSGAAPDPDARRAIEAEHARRGEEERRRHEVRAVVHPVQMQEWEIITQRAAWPLTSRDGHSAELVGQRVLSGDGTWMIGCAHCGARALGAIVVCHRDHAACDACAFTCTVCETGFCRTHGIAACHVDSRPACSTHARTCASCRKSYCTTHEAICNQGAHPVCSACATACAQCGAMVCQSHAVQSVPSAPRGSRHLCPDCVRYCEGSTSEPVGADEVRRCASCSNDVCERHQAICAIDDQVHCSKHLRRTDRSRRLLCEQHRGACAYEPEAIFALDELTECSTCHARGCDTHTGVCAADGARHCTAHLAALLDRKGSFGCVEHRTMCHVDGATYSVAGTWACPICGKRSCAAHLHSCPNCARMVCTQELERPVGRICRTCRSLEGTSDPDDRIVQASIAVRGEKLASPRGWRVARDATHTVVELDHGWTRRTVFTVRHGEVTPDGAVTHSLLGSKRLS